MNGEVKGMEERMTEKQIVDITNAAIDAPNNLFKIKGREWCIDLLGEVELLNQQLTEKDATIKELKEDKRKLHAIHDEQCARSSEYYNEIARLRKALEEARNTLDGILGDAEFSDSVVYEASTAIKKINVALGEGDKE